MQDGTFITRVFIVGIIIMLIYVGVDMMKHKRNLETLIIDQQDVIQEQDLTIKQMQRVNMLMYQYISQQQSTNVIH